MTAEQIEELIREVRQVLAGIDADELDVVPGSQYGIRTGKGYGWWETCGGVEFGAERLAALEALLRNRLNP